MICSMVGHQSHPKWVAGENPNYYVNRDNPYTLPGVRKLKPVRLRLPPTFLRYRGVQQPHVSGCEVG